MSRQYIQKPTTNLPWNWTDQRVMEIMKKYQQPTSTKPTLERTPLRNRNCNQVQDTHNSKSPWKNNYYCRPPPQESRQECRTPQNRTLDCYTKENSYERMEVRGRERERERERGTAKKRYDEVPAFYAGEDCTQTRRSKESELIDAQNYLREQERKYLRNDALEQEGNRRQARAEREPPRKEKMKTEVSEMPWNEPRKHSFKDVEYEPRISNIERINNKIKKILEAGIGNDKLNNQSTTQQLKPSPVLNKKQYQNKDSGGYQEGRKIEERSKSCLALKKNILPPSSELSQKVNDQLTKFNNKITEFQEQKRKLNICFKPADLQPEPVKTPTAVDKNKMKLSFQNELAEISALCDTQVAQQTSQLIVEQAQASPNFHSPYIGLKELDSRNDSLNTEAKEQVKEITRNMQLRRRQREAEEEPVEKESPLETNKLLTMLSEQVQLDEQLQLTKKWFSNSAQQADWALLQELLSQRWREMTAEEIQCEFSISLDEEDPFYSYRPEQFQLQDLVANYIISCRHWGQKVEGQWSGQRLRAQGCFQRLDREGRKELAVEDLVREINLSQGVFFRNRNLYPVFQRMTQQGNQRLTEERWYAVLNKK